MQIDAILNKAGKIVAPGDDPQRSYWLSEAAAYRSIAALAAGRPMLIRGEPGCGKTSLASVLAHLLDRRLVSATVQSHTGGEDLLWSIDYTSRLAAAQENTLSDQIEDYINAGAAWWTINPKQAAAMGGKAGYRPDKPKDHRPAVLLIDEIEKAGIALANSLLQLMAENAFDVPPIAGKVEVPKDVDPPLILFTSNDTRELPPAFVRRCVVIELDLTDNPAEHLCRIGQARFPGLTTEIVEDIAAEILQERDQSDRYRAGLAEFLDYLRALHELAPDDHDAQRMWREKLSGSFLKQGATAR